MIVLTCVCVPQPGQEEESKAAARELTEKSQDHKGLIGYFWNLDEDTQDLHVIEVHENEASVLNHITLTDFTRLSSISTVKDIRLFGDAPSPTLLEALSGFGEYKIYPSL
jgi:quinol monooxygenase YgiN